MLSTSRHIYCKWVVNALKALGYAKPSDVYDWIRNNEAVPTADLTGITDDGENLFEKNVRWARFQLRHEGVVTSPARGIWALAKAAP